MTEFRLDRLTSPQAARLLETAAACVLPCGSLEQHGPHLPLATDTIIAVGLAERLIARISPEIALCQLPSLAFGRSPEHMSFPGTVSISRHALCEAVRSVCASLAAHGVGHLLVMNAHGGNTAAIESMLRDARDETGTIPLLFDVARCDAVRAEAEAGDWHAGRIETSLFRVLAGKNEATPDAGGNRATPERASSGAVAPWRALATLSVPWRTEELSADGAIGDAAGADAPLGERIARGIVDEAADALRAVLGWTSEAT